MDPLPALRELFGFDAFRPGQREAVDAALAGHDVLVVMPTGAGKSLCYQLPALLRDDLTIVVSPLVSLMQDQVEALRRRVGPERVGLVNAQQDAAVNEATVHAAVRGAMRLLYVAPERFSSPAFARAMRAAKVGLFVVDEAHCVSQWGHDFRPDYFRLADAARWLGADAIMASTATATPRVARDIADRLALREPVRVTTGFDRPNLGFDVLAPANPALNARRIAAALGEPGATPAIVYGGTRQRCEDLAGRLAESLGREVLVYHAGLPRDVRARAQRRFMDGEVDVVVATNAFGMGVDKADVRTVVHDGVPSSLEAYYQEAGRAGRDGRPARALLLPGTRDKGLHVFFIQRGQLAEGQLEAVAARLDRSSTPTLEGPALFDVSVAELGAEEEAVRAIVGHLAQAGVLQPAPAPPDRVRGRLVAPFDAAARTLCRSLASEAERIRWAQYRAVWAWVEGDTCRRAGLLAHFGDASPGAPTVPCCDVCAPDAVPEAVRRAGERAGARRSSGGDRGGGAGAPGVGLDDAIVAVVEGADPSVGRTRVVEILRGGRTKVVTKYAYDGLPEYGTFDHLGAGEVLARVDALIAAGTIESTGGMYPKLRVTRAGQEQLA